MTSTSDENVNYVRQLSYNENIYSIEDREARNTLDTKADKATTYTKDEIDSISNELENKINTEKTARESADTNLENLINAETTRATNKENELNTSIANEITRATGAEESLQNNITSEIERVSGIISGVEASLQEQINNIDGEAGDIEENLNNEISARESADNALQENIDTLSTNLSNVENELRTNLINEISNRQTEDTALRNSINTLSTNLSNEITRATGVENDLNNNKLDKISTANRVYGTDENGNQTSYDYDSFGKVDDVQVNGTSIVSNKVANITLGTMAESKDDYVLLSEYTNKITSLESADNALQENIDTLSTNLSNEITRAINKENELNTSIANEITRALGVESTLQNQINNIDGDAGTIATDLSNEITRALGIEESLQNQINTNDNDIEALTTSLSNESTRASNKENEIEGNLNTHTSNKNNPHEVTKTQIGLGNVDNTSDLDKPISNATQTALNQKVSDIKIGENSIVSNMIAVLGTMSNKSSDDYYTKTEINGKISAGMHYRGTVASYNNLPNENNEIGDLYNVLDTGSNYAWSGDSWDKLSENIDLSAYALTSYVDTAINNEISNRQSAINNLQASLDSEILTRQVEDTSIRVELTAEKSNRSNADANLNANISEEIRRAKIVEGTLSNLNTENKDNLVSAINEVNSNLLSETNRATLIENGLRTDVDKKISKYSSLPTALEDNLNEIVQYIGNTNNKYTNGYFYKCLMHSNAPDSVTFIPDENTQTIITVSTEDFRKFIESKCEFVSADPTTITHGKISMGTGGRYGFDMYAGDTVVRSVSFPIQEFLDAGFTFTPPLGTQEGVVFECTIGNRTYSWERVDVQPAIDVSEKLDKISDSSKVYGTDANGNQTSYDVDSFGKVDDVQVNGTSVVSNKVTNITLGTMAGETASDYSTKAVADTLYANISLESTVSNIAQALSDETNRATSAESNLNGKIKGEITNRTNDITNLSTLKADKSNTYTKEEINGMLSGAMHFKGSVATMEDLEYIQNPQIGDMYNVIENGGNYAWDGENWIKMSDGVDLSAYALTSYVDTAINNEINARTNADSTKVDKVNYTNIVYGTDKNGLQFTYDIALFGNIDDVVMSDGTSLVNNRIATLGTIANRSSNDYYIKTDFANVATSGSYNDLTDKPSIPNAQVQSDWNATSGMGVILNKPTIPDAQVQSDWNVSDTNSMAYIINKPIIPNAQVQSDWNATSGMGVILNKPTLSAVATTGKYSDLLNKPDIPTVEQTYNASSTNAQSGIAVKSAIDNAISSVYKVAGSIEFVNLPALVKANEGKVYNVIDSFTTNSNFVEGAGKFYHSGTNVVIIDIGNSTYKYDVLGAFIDLSDYVTSSSLANVATSGDYNDLSNKPTIPDAELQSDWNITDTNSMAYIINKATIPAAQVQSDWNAVSGMGVILNKPTLANVATTGEYSDLVNKPNIPTTDTTYNASSTNAQSGTAIEGMMSAKFQVVDSLPENPTTGVFYFIKE